MSGTLTSESLKQQLKGKLEHVGGWLYLEEAWQLLDCVRARCGRPKPPLVVEIGSYKGRSTIALAMGVKLCGNGIVYAIDPHISDQPAHVQQYGTGDTYQEFVDNVKRAGVADVVQPLRMTSLAAKSTFQPRTIDVLFVDGSHEYEDVIADIDAYSPLLADCASVAFNDPSNPGVYRALKDRVLLPNAGYHAPRLVQNTLFFEFSRPSRWTKADNATLRRLRFTLALRANAAQIRPYMPMWLVRVGHAASRAMVGGASH